MLHIARAGVEAQAGPPARGRRLFLVTLIVAGSLSSDPLSGQMMLGVRGGLFGGGEKGAGLEGGVFLETGLGWSLGSLEKTAVVVEAFLGAARFEETSDDVGASVFFKARSGGSPGSIHLFLGPSFGRTSKDLSDKNFFGLRLGGGLAGQIGESARWLLDLEQFLGAGDAPHYTSAKVGMAFQVR